VILSEEDIEGDESLVIELSRSIPLVVLTRADRGATVLERGRLTDVPALRADVRDPTGAGDVFAAAFLGALHRGHNSIAAARWACAAAAFAIEAPGATGLATTPQIERRLRDS
jgi:sugar/nucleoside kinase (ribokinase family)